MYDPTALARLDETWHRLINWTYGQAPSERLSAQILAASGYESIDPSHPLGGPDGGRDGECSFKGVKAVYAVYFPRGQQSFPMIKEKFEADLKSSSKFSPERMAFVTNQELRLAEREELRNLGGKVEVDIFHLERVAGVLDTPPMHLIREQYLKISSGRPPILVEVTVEGEAGQLIEDREVFDMFVDIEEERIREKSDEAQARLTEEESKREKAEQRSNNPLGLNWPDFGLRVDPVIPQITPSWLGPIEETESKPLNEEDIVSKVAQYEVELESRWASCQDYVMGFSWSALRFRIKNLQKSFLKNVQVVLTFQDARAVEAKDAENFDILKVENPERKAYSGIMGALDMSYVPFRRDDEEITWGQNDAGDLEVIITLKSLRPHPEWRSQEYHPQLVLTTPNRAEKDSVTFSYTVTAEEYGDFFESGPVEIPVVQKSMHGAIGRAEQAK